MKRSSTWSILGFLMLGLTSAPAVASGFSFFEQSAKASGQAGAWVARADDAAAAWYNPAAMVHNAGMQVQFGANLVNAGSDSEFTVDDPAWEGLASSLGPPVASGQGFEAESNLATPIHLYFTQRINERIAWGLSVNNPFGLVTEWADRPLTFSSLKAHLVTLVVNPNVAVKLSDHWSVAVGIDYLYADVKDFSREVVQADLVQTYLDLAGAGFPTMPQGLDPSDAATIGRTNLTGDGDDWSFNVAGCFARTTGPSAWPTGASTPP